MMKQVTGGVCAAQGFSAAGIHCGIRRNQSKRDLALIYSTVPASAAAVYTSNLVKGAPLTVTKAHLADGKAQAVICNSGNANTCNADGVAVAEEMSALAAAQLHIAPQDVIVASTGVIGQPLDLAPIRSGLPQLAAALGDHSDQAAEGIMTTDTHRKEIAVQFTAGGKTCTIGGIAKGSGMIHPNLATMLVFLTTDCAISPAMLQAALSGDVQDTFNMVSVDGDTSTNDMVAILANGLAGNAEITAPDAQLAQLLCEKTGMKKVFFSNSGAEANECAIKAARKYAADHKGPEYHTIITLKNSFHGRTITTLAATGQDVFHHDFLPLTEGFAYAEANNLDDLKAQVAAHKCAAIMMEVVQGEGGVIPLTQEFVKGAAQLAAEQDILLICDEVQIGNGRSGKLYGYMHYGITPDIVSTAKGLGGGLPLGATLLGEKVQDVLTPGSHGSTFGGNPVCCAGALSILHRIDGPLLQSVQEKSDFIVNELTGAKGVKSVTGLGLMLGVEPERPVKDVINECMARGVLVISAKNKVRLLPALNIPMAQLEQAVSVLKDVCAGE